MKNIGVIDSGVGGLTVLFDVISKYPNCNYYYIGDSKNCPYGNKTNDEIKTLSLKIVDYLVKNKNIDILIIACNTISSTSLDYLQDKFKDLKIIGTIIPTTNYIKEKIGNKKIGIIATNATINSHAYENNLKNYEVYSKACPKFAQIVESGIITKEEEKIIFNDLNDVLINDIDALILGCTHYPLLIPTIRKVYNKTIITSSEAIIEELNKLNINNNSKASLELFTTGDSKNFELLVKKMFKKDVKANTINL